MKKALALVLALVLALSMAVSAFATLIELDVVKPETDDPATIYVVDMDDDAKILYTRPFMPIWNAVNEEKLTDSYVTYIAIWDQDDEGKDIAYKDIKLTANGNIDAELVKFDPETMVEDGALDFTYSVYYKGEPVEIAGFDEDGDALPVGEAYEAALAKTPNKLLAMEEGWIPTAEIDEYENAAAIAAFLKGFYKHSGFTVVCEQTAYIIKLTVENNFSAHYTEGTLKIEATRVADKKAVAKTLEVINDVSIFEYEEVKYAAENNAKGATLQLGDGGYSDYWTDEFGYGSEYDEEWLRRFPFALVVSTTAFRAIEGKDLTLDVATPASFGERVAEILKEEKIDFEISVTLKEIAKGQKGINFFAWAEIEGVELNPDEDEDFDPHPSAISFGFMGDQVVKGKYEITVDLPIDYYELRELFDIKVEEDDIINYYVVDQDNNVVKTIKVDYMTDDISENVEFTVEGENEKLGWYTLCLEVPAVEAEGEENPNTGAESVVGVVAALAVVSVATAAAVSLKK